MSYKALYRTYRPKNFKEVIGQDHIVSTLTNIISNNKVGHAYLFAGPRGTGKTSVAHVFARAVNINAAGEEVFGDMDITEIDAASNNGVAEVRTIIDNVNYAPSKAKYKVYIIDEVHMLTKGAFNALLKTLEEPPAHIIFILATTEPHKIPVTILSRTQRFNFRRIDDVIIGKQLEKVLTKEKIKFDDEAIKFISKLAQGGMRDALSIADQSSAFGNGVLSFEAISQVFGIISIENQIKLFNFAYQGATKELMMLISELLNNGADIERISSSLLDILKDYIILNKTGDENLVSFLTVSEINSLNIDVNYAYETVDIIIKLINDLRFTAVPRQSFELAILKIAKGPTQQNKEIFIEKSKSFTQKIRDEKKMNIFEDKKDEPFLEIESDINLDIVKQEQEEMIEQSEVENDILSTQEIPVGEIQLQENTSEIDIMKLFENNNNFSETKAKRLKENSVDDIINLLVQASREKLNLAKKSIEKASNFLNDKKFKQFAELISKSKVIASGESFILLSSEDKHIINGINSEATNQEFIRFINKICEKPLKVTAITKQEFEFVKDTYNKLRVSNILPEPEKVIAPKLTELPKTEEEEFGTSLFGELFPG